jgi:hypothetical protein
MKLRRVSLITEERLSSLVMISMGFEEIFVNTIDTKLEVSKVCSRYSQ